MNRALIGLLAATVVTAATLALTGPDDTASADDAAAGLLPARRAAAPGSTATGQASPPRTGPRTAEIAAEAISPPAPPMPRGSAWPTPSATSLAAWQPVPPPPPPPPPPTPTKPTPIVPAKPAAPAFPYQWIGLLDDGVAPMALLNGPQRSLAVVAGAPIDAQWRLDRVTDTQLTLTWLPGGDSVSVTARPPP